MRGGGRRGGGGVGVGRSVEKDYVCDFGRVFTFLFFVSILISLIFGLVVPAPILIRRIFTEMGRKN